ncbi:sensor domain-containing diguanylate cyclase [Pseudomonas citronellolis]|uniref:sensor domain-containing diguanylate cyclase n=1 Tax=Pseudomonas citronellolis TaxID=53408 RepID=UPI0023E47876|nr:diguanylate cyclase [Pseudomonas citronellolis]MDF3934480.1 diguanylate cyclase [Pseudomonas citronellolis]
MSIRVRLLWVAIPLLVATLLAVQLLSRGLLLERFDAGDQFQISEQADNLALQIDSFIIRSLNVLRSTALSADAYAFVQHRNPEFAAKNLDLDSVRNLDFNFILYFDNQGHLIGERWVMPTDTEWGDGQALPNPHALRTEIIRRSRELGLLVAHHSALETRAQLLSVQGVPTVLVSTPVSDALGQAVPMGNAIAGRLLGPRRVEHLGRFILGTLQVLPAAQDQAWQPISGSRFLHEPYIHLGERSLVGDSAQRIDLGFSDNRNTPQLRMRILQPRYLYLQGRRAVWLFLGLAAGLSLLAIGLTAWSLEHWVLRRVQRLAGEVAAIGPDTPVPRLSLDGDDEIGRLGADLNAMLERLSLSEQRDRSILAGISDGYFEMDRDCHLGASNPALCELLGRTDQQLQGASLRELLAESGEAGKLEQLLASLDEQRHAVFSAPWHCPEGPRHCEARLSAIRGSTGEVIGYRALLRDISDLVAYQSELEDLAFSDALTGLANRKALQARLLQLCAEPTRPARSSALLFIDLDNFKQANDRFGHDIGDGLLVAFSERLRRCLRGGDDAFRLGGDEFTVLLGNARQAQAQAFARRLLSVLGQPYVIAGQRIDFVSASIGVALYPQDADSPEELLKAADAAMYRAKRTRNACCFHSPAPWTLPPAARG